MEPNIKKSKPGLSKGKSQVVGLNSTSKFYNNKDIQEESSDGQNLRDEVIDNELQTEHSQPQELAAETISSVPSKESSNRDSFAQRQAEFKRIRRASFEKKMKLCKRNKKCLDILEEYMQVRYVLYYADEIVQESILTKSEVRYHQIFNNNQCYTLDRQYETKLREVDGIYFKMIVKLPTFDKDAFNNLNMPYKKSLDKSDELQQKDGGVSRQTFGQFGGQGQIEDRNNDYKSPTFKGARSDMNSFSESFKESVSGENQSRPSDLQHQNTHARMDQMLLSDSNDAQFITDFQLDSQLMPDDQQIPNLERNDTKHSVRNIQSCEPSSDYGSFHQWDGLVQMRKRSSFIYNNYQSPDCREIDAAKRKREIEDIDKKYLNKKKLLVIDLDQRGQMGEIVEHHNSGVNKVDFRKSHSYEMSPKRSSSGINSTKKENLFLKLQPLESQIDEESQDAETIKEHQVAPENNENKELQNLSSDKNQEYNDQLSRLEEYSFQSVEERSLDSGFNNGLNIKIGDIDNEKTGVHVNPNSHRSGRDRIQVEYVEQNEPKSGQLKQKEGLKRVGTMIKFDMRNRGKSKDLLSQKQNNSNSDSKCEGLSNRSNSSGTSSEHDGEEALRLVRWKSILTFKKSVGTKMLESQHQRYLRNGQESGDQDSLIHTTSLIEEDTQNDLFNSKKRLTNKSFQLQHNRSNFLFNQPMKVPLQQVRSSVLSIRKIETEQETKTLNLETLQQSSKNQKTTFRKDKNEKDSSYKPYNKKNQDLPNTSLVNTNGLTDMQTSKDIRKLMRQRKREIDQMRKILTKQEKEEQEEIEFCKNQEKALIKIKRLCEKLCGKKITDGYVGEDYLSKTVDDLSKSEFTYNNNDINKEAANWLQGATLQKSIGSKADRSGGSISPLEPIQPNRLQVPTLVQNQKSYDGINENFINTSICKSENDFLISQKNLEPAENPRINNRSSQLNAYDVDRDQNSSNKKKKVNRISKSKGRGRADTLSINLNGFEHDNKIDLNVKNMYSCQSLTSKNQKSQKSEQSMESLLHDLKSQQSKTAYDLRKQRSKYKIEKRVSKKNLNLSAHSQERSIEQPTLLSNFADQKSYLQIKSRQDLGLTINKGSQQYQANIFKDAFSQQDNLLNSNEKKIEPVQNIVNSTKQPQKRTAVRDEGSIQKQDEYTHRITGGTITPSSKNEEEMFSPDLPNVLNRQPVINLLAPPPTSNNTLLPQVSAFEPMDGPNNNLRHSNIFSESQEATQIHLNIGQQKMDVEEEMKQKAASPIVQEDFNDSEDIFERQEDGDQLIDLDQLEDQIIHRHSSLQQEDTEQMLIRSSAVGQQTNQHNNRLSNLSNLQIKTDSAIISPDNKTSFQFNLSGGKVIPNAPNNYQSQSVKFANDEINARTRNNLKIQYGFLQSDRQGTLASGEGSEFSFQKSPVGLNKYDKGSGNHDKFEISLAKLETFSFKKTDSPMHYQRLNENDHYLNQNQSISEVNSSVNVRGGSSSQSVRQINQSTSSQAKQPNGAYLQSLSLNLKSCLQDIDAEIDQRQENIVQINRVQVNQSHLQIPLTLKKEKSALSTISQRTESQSKGQAKKGKQISKYEQEYNQKKLLLSQQNSKLKQSIVEQSQRSKSSTSLFDKKEEQTGFQINLQHQSRNLQSEAKSGNKASRGQIIEQDAFKSEITLFRQQNSKSQIESKFTSPPKATNLVLSKNESQEKIRRIELQISKNTRSGENSVQKECFVLDYENNEFFPQSRNSRILQTKQSSVFGRDADDIRMSQDLYHTFENQSSSKRNQSKNKKPYNEAMSKTSSLIPPVPHHQNRVSLGGMVFGLQVKQFSESPLKQGARKMSENAQQRSNAKITQQKLQNKNSRDRSIDEDLDELQSMLTRHHGRLKKTKNSNAPIPVGYQSSYGGMSYAVATGAKKNLFPVQKGATSAYTGYPMMGRGTGSMLQKPSKQYWQNSSHNNSQDIRPAPTGNKIYQINDQAENISIFNGSESHLNEELSQFDQGIDQPPGFKGLFVDVPLFGRANSNQFLSPDKKTNPYAQESIFNTMKPVDSRKLTPNKYAKPIGNTPQRPPIPTKMPTITRSNRGADRPQKQGRKYPIGYTHNTKMHELETEQSPQPAIPGLGLQKSDDNMFDFSNDEDEIPEDQRVSGEFKRQDSNEPMNQNFMLTQDSKNSKRGFIMQEILKKDEKMPVYFDANEGNRFSILSEIVQAQPYRSSKERVKDVQVVDTNPFGDAEPEDDNPFGQAEPYDPTISMNNIPLPNSKGSSFVTKMEKTNSGKSSTIAQINSNSGHFQTTGGVIGRISGGKQMRESLVMTTPPKVIVEEDSSDLASAGSPFNLKLGKYNDSEPFQKRYVDRRMNLLKRDDV